MSYLTATAASALMLAGAMTLAIAAPKPTTPPPAPAATADLKMADGKDVGTVALTQTAAGVRLRLTLKGLPDSPQLVWDL